MVVAPVRLPLTKCYAARAAERLKGNLASARDCRLPSPIPRPHDTSMASMPGADKRVAEASPPTSAPNSAPNSTEGRGRRKEKKSRKLPETYCDVESCTTPACGPSPGATNCYVHGGGWTFTCCICAESKRRPNVKPVSDGTRLMFWIAAGECPPNLGLDHAAQCETCYKKTNTRAAFFGKLLFVAPTSLPMNKDGDAASYNPAGAPFELSNDVPRSLVARRMKDELDKKTILSDRVLSQMLFVLVQPPDASWVAAPAGEDGTAFYLASFNCVLRTSARPLPLPSPRLR